MSTILYITQSITYTSINIHKPTYLILIRRTLSMRKVVGVLNGQHNDDHAQYINHGVVKQQGAPVQGAHLFQSVL